MIKIAVCDDEDRYLNKISNEIEKRFRDRNINIELYKFLDNQHFVDLIKKGELNCDAVFLDIEMPENSGLEIAELVKKFNPDALIIFATSFDNYVFEAFNYEAFAYIRKRKFDAEIDTVVNRLIKKFTQSHNKILFRNSEGQFLICPSEILYFESFDHSIYIHKSNNEVVTITNSLKQLEQDMSVYNFCRIHSGILVNLNYVYSIEKTSLLVKSSGELKSLPVSRNRLKSVKQAFQRNLRGV